MVRKLEHLSRRQQQATPFRLADWLVSIVARSCRSSAVAALFVADDSIYKSMRGVDCWDRHRDATKCGGPLPAVCHPHCGPWGKYSAVCNQERTHGPFAMDYVNTYGGVVEHPVGSSLFREYGLWDRGMQVLIHQEWFGHEALKPTLLYFTSPHGVETIQEAIYELSF